MRYMLGGGAAVAAMAVLAIGAGGASAQAARSTLTIDGTSTVRGWTCEAESFQVAPSPVVGFEDAVLEGRPALESVTLTFPVAAIDCGNGTMNSHLRKALRADTHPQIRYRLSAYDIERAESGVAVSARGELTIAGTARPITMAVTLTRDATGAVRVQGEQAVRMTDFGVTPPTLMLGTLKVGDTVKVSFDVPLRPQRIEVASGQR